MPAPHSTRLNLTNAQHTPQVAGFQMPWTCESCTFENHAFPSICEVCDISNPRYPESIATLRALHADEKAQAGRSSALTALTAVCEEDEEDAEDVEDAEERQEREACDAKRESCEEVGCKEVGSTKACVWPVPSSEQRDKGEMQAALTQRDTGELQAALAQLALEHCDRWAQWRAICEMGGTGGKHSAPAAATPASVTPTAPLPATSAAPVVHPATPSPGDSSSRRVLKLTVLSAGDLLTIVHKGAEGSLLLLDKHGGDAFEFASASHQPASLPLHAWLRNAVTDLKHRMPASLPAATLAEVKRLIATLEPCLTGSAAPYEVLISDVTGESRIECAGGAPPVGTLPTNVCSPCASLAAFADRLPSARNIIVMVGAGASVSAGIPDFRSPGTGLYDNLQKFNLPFPEAVFDLGFFATNPWPFYRLSAELWPGNYAPTPAHHFIKLLHSRGQLLRCYTQNIDSLEVAAGIPAESIVAAHGNFDSAHVVGTGAPVPIAELKRALDAGQEAVCALNA